MRGALMVMPNAAYAHVMRIADFVTERQCPGGVASSPTAEVTDAAFDFYVAQHGVPKDANAARRMFEFVSILQIACQHVTSHGIDLGVGRPTS
jgi:hypothetical protein